MKTTTVLARGGLVALILIALGGMTAASAQPLFTMDAAAFQQKGGQVYLEVYLMIQRNALKFAQVDSAFTAPVDITLELRTAADSLLSSTPWQVVDKVASLDQVSPKQKLPDIAIFPQLSPGKYILVGRVRDVNRDTTFVRSMDLDLKSVGDTTLAVSDLELATRLEKTDAKNKFCKNGFLVVPNPEHLYGLTLPMLYYYAEIYNLRGTGGEYTVDRVITDNQGKEIKKLPQKTHKKVGAAVVDVDGISVASLKSGKYLLKVSVTDQGADSLVSTAQTWFLVFRPEDYSKEAANKNVSSEEQEIMGYDEQQLKDALEGIKFLLSDGEWRSLDMLNLDGKRRFLINFWNSRDPDPSTPANEFKQTYEDRRKIANERFGYFNREGWQTDRGRVYILYGPPDNIESHAHDMETRPYEIWTYDSIEGGVLFVFVDHNSFGDYRLVHSTKNGELNRPNWYNEEAVVQRK